MKLVLIPAGEFLMGSPDSENGAGSGERPQHRVQITRPFYLGATEVTQEQYRVVTGQSPSLSKGDVLPVESASWEDAIAFCNKLNELEKGSLAGAIYHLPTEAEWEYACRAGTPTRFSFGDLDAGLGDYAWFIGNSGDKRHRVGQKRPNAWGLFDMHGNVREWCLDYFDNEYYAGSPDTDPPGPSQADVRYRVSRGGSSADLPQGCRSATRWRGSTGGNYNTGFRVARVQSGR
jgi:formylglycine-generating enzyme required for sulfatase activity